MTINSLLLDYYTNLLIIQYHEKPRAKATIMALLSILIIYDLIIAVREAYNIETAIGKQLDVLGKYAGVTRFYYEWHFKQRKNFAMPSRREVYTPTEYQAGFSTYETFSKIGNFLKADDIYLETRQLTDDQYRQLIKLKIAHNYSNGSYKSVLDGVYNAFVTELVVSTMDQMCITYFINNITNPAIDAAIQKDIVLRPATVGSLVINRKDKRFFGFASKNRVNSTNTTGFSIYSNYETKQGHFLSINDFYLMYNLKP